MSDFDDLTSESILSDIREKTKEPPMYKVLMHNDDYTTMDFVVSVLMSIFNKSTFDAEQIMMRIHKEGIAVCGIYTYEIAETKVNEVHNLARHNGFPLKSTFEKV
ncbi:MAG: ATP-dependent Clp protease adapter ClpS [Proteobacteria bacterium]|nr:ATP-dependent Clp protease adapter ClpS [Pseudomonadota bacterium]